MGCRYKFGVDVNSNANLTCTNTITTHHCVCDNYWLALSTGLGDVVEAGSAVPDKKKLSGLTFTQSRSRFSGICAVLPFLAAKRPFIALSLEELSLEELA